MCLQENSLMLLHTMNLVERSNHAFKWRRDYQLFINMSTLIHPYPGIFKHIQIYSGIFRHNQGDSRIIQAYSSIFRTVQTLAYFKTGAHSEPWYTQNSDISRPLAYTLFYISNTLTSNARLKLAQNQANAKQHPETELLLFENYSHFSSTLYHPK